MPPSNTACRLSKSDLPNWRAVLSRGLVNIREKSPGLDNGFGPKSAEDAAPPAESALIQAFRIADSGQTRPDSEANTSPSAPPASFRPSAKSW